MFCSNYESGDRTVLCVATNCETAGIHAAIGGPTGHLFEHNSQIIGQIRANLAACKLQENTELLVQFKDNIFAILNGMTNMPGIMSQMPPLPVKLNLELADRILPLSQSSNPLHH
jgi:hypothetical protein